MQELFPSGFVLLFQGLGENSVNRGMHSLNLVSVLVFKIEIQISFMLAKGSQSVTIQAT